MARTKKKNPYRGSRAFDTSCRNHGSCSFCTHNRTFQGHKAAEAAKREIQEDGK